MPRFSEDPVWTTSQERIIDYDDDLEVPLTKVDEYDETIDDKIDVVLVYHNSDMVRSLKKARINHFLRNLEKVGLGVVRVWSLSDPNLVFVKISADNDLIYHYAPGFGIDLHCNNRYFVPETPKDFKNIFDMKGSEHISIKRISQSIGGIKIAEITSCERIMVIIKIMSITKYGVMDDETGIKKLLEVGTFTTMYPVHDQDESYKRSNLMMMGDRLLLIKYWGSWKYIFKVQPIFLIQKYFGAEVGFYYAYTNFYSGMLIFAAVLGICSVLFGIVTSRTGNNFKSPEVCSSTLVMCPFCPNFDICPYEELKTYCELSYIDYILDNQATIVYGILISIWSALVVEFWKRKRAFLGYQWNVYSINVDLSIRHEYESHAKFKKLSPVTGEWESCDTPGTTFCHLFVSYAAMLLLCAVAMASLFGVRIYYNATVTALADADTQLVKNNAYFLAIFLSSVISVLVMIILQFIYKKAAKWLVDIENPRTELEYDTSYTYKFAILSFINGFGVAVYVAFIKGNLYKTPKEADTFGSLRSEQCKPTGCNDDLSVHVIVILIFRCFVADIYNFCRSIVLMKWSKRKIRKAYQGKLPSYEEEYYLESPSRFFLINKYQQIALQYGYVTLFSASFPLTPALVLVHMLVQIRYDAITLLKRYRRPVPLRVSGLGGWRTILRLMTQIGCVSQAFILGTTLSFVPTQIALYSENYTTNKYYAGRFSVFDTKDYDPHLLEKYPNVVHPATCLYNARRYPPDHPDKYQLSGKFWYELCWTMTFIIIFQQLVIGITGIISYAIPDVPSSLKSTIEQEHMVLFKKTFAAKQTEKTSTDFVSSS